MTITYITSYGCCYLYFNIALFLFYVFVFLFLQGEFLLLAYNELKFPTLINR